MWIFTIYGFYSIACATGPDGRPDPETVMVRARKKKHLQNLKDKFPSIEGEIATSKTADYRFRFLLPKAEWVPILGELAQEQSWSNFKSKVHANEAQCGEEYGRALHTVWGTMNALQREEN